jgi:hypothetical protein
MGWDRKRRRLPYRQKKTEVWIVVRVARRTNCGLSSARERKRY